MNKRDRGITLIVLVITIIVLLILAGITLTLVIGENGLISRAQQAGKNTAEAQDYENTQLAGLESEMDSKISGTREQITVDKAQYEQLLADVESLKNSKGSTTVLWEGSQTTTGTIDLNDSIENYDMVQVVGKTSSTVTSQTNSIIILKQDYYTAVTEPVKGWTFLINNSISGSTRRIGFGFANDRQITLADVTVMELTKVYGIKN